MRPDQPTALHLACALAALLALGACASTSPDTAQHDVNWLVSHGRYDEAVRLAAKRHAEQPNDALAEKQWRMATVALLLSEGRKLCFDDRDLEALDKFRQALELAPEVSKTKNWVDATLDKLADQWTARAQEWHSKNNLENAIEDYEKALSYREDRVNAKAGLSRALLQLNYRNGQSENYYTDGVRALDEYWLFQAAHGFGVAIKYNEEHERAISRKAQTATLCADERVRLAANLEDEGQFAAARTEYRIATLCDPEHAEAKAGLERARKEDKAADLLRDAERRKLHNQFDKAEKALDEGAALTTRQADSFEAARVNLVEARLQHLYDEALAREKDRDYEQAVIGYEAVLVEAEHRTGQRVFKDTIARKDSLEQSIRDAHTLYAQLATLSDPAEQLRLLRKIEVIWPEYLDVRARLAVLEAATGGR